MWKTCAPQIREVSLLRQLFSQERNISDDDSSPNPFFSNTNWFILYPSDYH